MHELHTLHKVMTDSENNLMCFVHEDKKVDLRSLAVPPGEIMMYLWKVTAEDAPTEADPRCLTRVYHSTLDPERDMASGLVGPLIICKSESLDKRGKVVSVTSQQKY